MFAISSSQKKTVFAVVFLALIAVWVMVSGRGGLSGLRSDFINDPGFVCTNESLVSGEVRHSWTAVDMQKFSAEKAGLQEKVQWWNSGIRKNEALIKKLEKQKTAAEKKQRTLEVAVKKQCTHPNLTTCSAKKKELQIVQQNIQKFQSSLINVTAQNKKLRIDIQTALSNIKLLETQILEIQNFKEDYETCKRTLEKAKIEVSSFDLIVSGEVYVNEPFDITVQALNTTGIANNNYEGKIFFDTNNNPADVILPFQENDGGSEYQFQASDNGVKLFEKGLTLKKAGLYEIVVFELNWTNDGIEKTVQIIAKEKTSPVTCTDSDNGLNYYTRGQTTLADDLIAVDFCSSANTLDEYICPTTPYEWWVSQSYTCPHGCSDGACKPTPTPIATCDSLTVTPTSVTNGGEFTYTCTGTNATSYSVAVYRAGGALFFSGTDRSGSFTLPTTPTGSYTVQCFVNDQGGSSPACQKTVENAAPAPGKLTVSVDSSTPPSRLLLDNMQEHSVAVFRLAASITENLDVDSIKITDAGTNGNDVVAYYRFYNSRGDHLGSATPDGDGNAELFLTNGSLVIPANDYKLVTVRAVIRDIDGIGFQNGDTLKATIAQATDIKATGATSGVAIKSVHTNIEGNTMTMYEAYPIVSFAPDSRIGSAVTLSTNQLIAKIAVSNPGDKDVTFQTGDGNRFSIQVQTVGDNTNTADETITLKDQDGITLDTGGAPSSFGVTQVDFDMSSAGANGTTIPSRSTKYFYIYANTTDLEDSSDRIQVWLDDTAADVTFGINGAGAFAVGAIINRGDQFGPILSRPN